MHNPESVQENEYLKLFWNFEIQTNHLISACRLDLGIVGKKNRTGLSVDLAVSADHRVKLKKNKNKREMYLKLARELKKKK